MIAWSALVPADLGNTLADRKTLCPRTSPFPGCAAVTDTPAPQVIRSVDEVYGDAFDDQEVEAALDESLSPRGLNQLMFDLVAQTGLPPGSSVLDSVPARDTTASSCRVASGSRCGVSSRSAAIWTTRPR